jgi:hypothetical protein
MMSNKGTKNLTSLIMDGLIKLGLNMGIETKWQMQDVSTTVVRRDEGI